MGLFKNQLLVYRVFFFFFIYFLKKLNKKWLSLVGRKLSRSGDTFGPNMII